MTTAAVGGEQVLLQYGALGAFAVLLTAFALGAWRDLKGRADRMEARNQALTDSLTDKVVPALVAATEAIRASATLVDDLRREREDLIDELRASRRRAGNGGA